MKVGALYNTGISLEEGDLFAVDPEGHLLIRQGDDLYRSVQKIDEEVPREIYVNSFGFYERDKNISVGRGKESLLLKDIVWSSFSEE